jgi:hypothetical protein
MRTVVIFVFVLAAISPAQASKSCMTMAEARAQFATSHLWWHGPNHCWDATPPQHRIVRRVKLKEHEADDDSAKPEIAAKDDGTTPARREPKWRNGMAEMLPADTPGVAAAVPSLPDIAAAGMNWLDRWVDVAQIADRRSKIRSHGHAGAFDPGVPEHRRDPRGHRAVVPQHHS